MGEATCSSRGWAEQRPSIPACAAARLRHRQGFTVAELAVVVGIIGVLAAASLPSLLSYLQATKLRAGAQELATILAGARELAITSNQFVCVEIVAGRFRLRTGPSSATVCAGGTVWVGPGTDGNGRIGLSEPLGLAVDQNPVFSSLGAAAPPASFTVTDPHTGQSTPVTISGTGRIRVGA